MLTLQLFIKGRWHDAAQLNIQHPHQGRESPALLAYNFDYAVEYLDRNDYASCSLNYPVMLIGSYAARPWFTFLDDIMPAGASRRYWIQQLGLQGKSAAEQDFWLLKSGTIAPVGNQRIKESIPALPAQSQLRDRRFPSEWAIERDSDFLAYAQQMGAASGGATGAGGEAPKLLLRYTPQDEVWIDTWQDDVHNQDAHYLVKYPRGARSAIDCDILRAEYHYYHELASMGFDTIPCEKMKLCEGSRYPSLWLPRFDVSYIAGEKVMYGLESVYSIMRKPPGSYLNHFEVISTLITHLNPDRRAQEAFVIEWVKRDMLNIAFGNSDNHGRNSAILKKDTGMWLAPIYDFAPMKADPEGVVRTTQWGAPFEEGGQYQWQKIAAALDDLVPSDRLLAELAVLARQLIGLKERLLQRGIPASILTMPALGFDYLDQRIEGWQL
ncbi:type II toxin-antitoxin system HipA family toxin [Pantoea ananatis]|uniref:type II toxin-antitoxin system HipA family toxin n=1 Tax=Pantoea ananas TaxID=553 RepID=UPI000491B078|nr:HipA domain-containing protein [Pantoea ananatis]MDJ0030470.1 HipA domain-containing protein [Pantoea ananatis]MDJ0043729.1 HipA domain-containing protein [Pantoea ananatis]CRH38977.1 HipA domain-containing protein {ECO:0000313/EMBL:CCF09004.1} [Pantoea ananatis]SFX25640.1 serine/threonine-protein kinase HipA [Pantoea ananatis]